MNQTNAKYLIIAGIAIVFIGILFYFLGDKLKWIGNLPGDIRIENENTSIYFPITTMILVSIIGSLLLNVFRRFF